MRILDFKGPNSYPNTVLIGDEVWEVRFVRSLPEDAVGLCDPSTKRLFIRYKQTRTETFKTFIHEVLHGIEDWYDVDIPHECVDKMEEGITDFLVENLESLLCLLTRSKPQ